MIINDINPNSLSEAEVAVLEATLATWYKNRQTDDIAKTANNDVLKENATSCDPTPNTRGDNPLDKDVCDNFEDDALLLSVAQMESVIGLRHSSMKSLIKKYPEMKKLFNFVASKRKWWVDEDAFLRGFPEEVALLKNGENVSHPLRWPTSIINRSLRESNLGGLRWGPSTWAHYGADVLSFAPSPNSGGSQRYYLTDIRPWKRSRPTLYNACIRAPRYSVKAPGF